MSATTTEERGVSLGLRQRGKFGLALCLGLAGKFFTAGLFGGLALLFKQIGSILQIGQFVLMAMAFTPVTILPGLALLPAMKGIHLVRSIATSEISLQQVSTTDWWLVIGNGVLWFGLGLLVFRLLERRALRTGVLGKY